MATSKSSFISASQEITEREWRRAARCPAQVPRRCSAAPPQGRQTLADPDEPDALGGRAGRAGIEADAVVPDGTADPPGFAANDNRHRRRPARACFHVGERLLDDPIQHGLDPGREPIVPRAFDLDPKPGSRLRHPGRGDRAPASVPDRREPLGAARETGVAAPPRYRRGSVFTDCSRAAAGAGRSRRDIVERQVHGGEELSRLVVQLVRDAAGLLLEQLVQPSERGIGLAYGPVRHLERAEALEHEAPPRPAPFSHSRGRRWQAATSAACRRVATSSTPGARSRRYARAHRPRGAPLRHLV